MQRNCNYILCAAAGKIQDHIIKALNIKINSIRQKVRNLRKSVARRISKEQLRSLKCKIKRITDKEREKIKQRQIRKYNRDNLVIKTCKKKNGRFSRKQLCAKLNRREKQKQNIVRTKETAPDENAINLTSTELSESQKLLIRKGPSFVPTPSDISMKYIGMKLEKALINLLSNCVTE